MSEPLLDLVYADTRLHEQGRERMPEDVHRAPRDTRRHCDRRKAVSVVNAVLPFRGLLRGADQVPGILLVWCQNGIL